MSIIDKLSAAELKILNERTVAFRRNLRGFAQRNFSFEVYLDKWIHTITEIRMGYTFGVYDYCNDIAVRDTLDGFLQSLPEEISNKLVPSMEAADNVFRNETMETDLSLLTDNEAQTMPWWWHRIPKKLTGELEDDISRLRESQIANIKSDQSES